jgi:ABC-type oligopeptide transport system substrate-binding subunit
MAIDRDVLASKIKGRGELPAYGLVPSGIDNYQSQHLSYKDWSQGQRVAEAQRLYKEAGFGPDNPLEIELRYNVMGGHEKIAVAIQAMWREALGFDAHLVTEEFKVMLANIQEMKVTEVYRLSWSGDYNDAYTFLQLLESDNPQNLTAYANPRVDELLRKAATEVDLVVRRDYLEEAERISLEDHPVIPLYFYVTKHMVAKDIEGWASMPLDYHYSKYLRRSNAGGE